MSSPVHIVISDRGWILERLAEEIRKRLPYITYDTSPDPDATIQYYMTYGTFKGRISPFEIGLFTHLEEHPAVAKKFFDAASSLDVSVAMSVATEQLLVGKAARTTTISPGVDLERFSPKIRIGVVGRTYHTGRKGEDLVASVQDIPDIEWVFTGDGWPGTAQFVPDAELPSLYRSLDYVLVPARIEGGPMSVLEALASGVEVIAPPIGWVPQFPHIEFKTGDAEDLRRVLLEVVEKRQKLRRSVEDYTWENWATRHHDLFVSLVGKDALDCEMSSTAVTDMRAIVAVHGVEMTASAGGPSVRAPMTARALKKVGVDAAFVHTGAFDAEATDVVHILNVWEPTECDLLIQMAKKAGKPTVLSSIYLDLTEHDIYSQLVPNIFKYGTDERIVLPAYAQLRAKLKARRREDLPSYEIMPGYYERVRSLISKVDHVILLSEDERRKLRRIGAEPAPGTSSIVHNPVVATNFNNVSPELFTHTYGVEDYVLVVGRIESRKNQLTLAYALRSLPYPVVFIGHNSDGSYLSLLKSVSGPNVHFIGRLEPNSEILASAFAGAKVFCLPSWSEGAPLAALEAAAAGCRMILSDRSSEREYFGDHAWYCDPADPSEMRELVIKAYEEDRTEQDREELKKIVSSRYGWTEYTNGTRAAYEAAIQRYESLSAQKTALASLQPGRVLIDLTTLAHRDGPPSGIARAEDRLAVELHNLYPDRVEFFLWNSHYQCFLPVSRQVLESGNLKQLRGAAASFAMRHANSKVPFDQMNFLSTDTIVVFGGAWIRNSSYVRDLNCLRQTYGLKLLATVYDVIQWKFMNWFPAGVGEEFAKNCKLILSCSDRVLTCSQQSKDDILQFAIEERVAPPPIDVFRLGDEAVSIDPEASVQLDQIASIVGTRPFILYVSAIDVRKNHNFLLDVWERLIQKHGPTFPKLILVGSKGWGGDAVINKLSASEKLKQSVHILHGINDETLQWLYIHCMFTVYPSLYEGWGLPVAESINLGKFCVASNAGSLPEIAPKIIDMIDPLDFIGWVERIERYALHAPVLNAREQLVKTYQRYTWTQTAKFVGDRINSVQSSVELIRLSVGSRCSFGDAVRASIADNICVGGWGKREEAGCWTIGASAVVCFAINSDKPVALSFDASAFMTEDNEPQHVDVTLNGVVIATWTVDGSLHSFSAPLKNELLGPGGRALVRLNIRNPRIPAESDTNSTDQRALGLWVKAMHIEPIAALIPSQWNGIAEGSSHEIVASFAAVESNAQRFFAIRLVADVAAILDVTANARAIARVPVNVGDQIRAVRLNEPGIASPESTMVTIRSQQAANIRILEVGVFEELPLEVMRSMRMDRIGDSMRQPIAHLPWYGQPAKISLSEEVRIVKDNQATIGMAGGWHSLELHGTWSDGSLSSLFFALPMVDSSHLLVELNLSPFEWVFAGGEEVEITVLIGSGEPKTIRRTDHSVRKASFVVPAGLALDAHRVLRVTLRGPAGITVPPDSRFLSFMLISIRIRPWRELTLAPSELLLTGTSAWPLFLENWHESEAAWTWSPGGSETKLQLPRLIGSHREVKVVIDLNIYSGLLANHGPCTLRFSINGLELVTDVRADADYRPVVLELPEGFSNSEHPPVLSIDAPVGVSPQDMNEGLDSRPLSFNIRSFHYLI